jgi:DNA-binding transcriptional LysR family regulator
MTISLRQLEYFVAVVDEGSFTAAAELLHVSQPGLSHQILALERDLGGPLLERLPRKVRLTPAGRTVLPHARASLAHAERVSMAAKRIAGLATGELHIGTLYSISVGVIPTALQVWRKSYPEVQAHLVEFRHTDDLAAAMEAGQADLAVGPAPVDWDGPTAEIGAEEFVIVAPPGSNFPAEPARIRLADLAEHEWVHFTAQSGLSNFLDQACLAAGFQPRVSVRTEQGSAALSMVRAGLGLALLPCNIIQPNFEGVILRPDPIIQRSLTVYTRVRPDPITAAFVAAIADATAVTPPYIAARLGPS